MTLRHFITASVLLHAALLAAWPLHPPTPGGGAANLRVALMDVPDPATAQQQPAHAHKAVRSEPKVASQAAKIDRHTSPKPRHHAPAHYPLRAVSYKTVQRSESSRQVAAPAPAKSRQPEPTPQAQLHKPRQRAAANPRPSHPIRSAEVSKGDVVSRVQANLHRRIQARFDYPLIARIKGWQGQVTLGLRVEPDGTLTHLRVIATSGYPILDRASLSTLKGIARVPPAADWLGGRHVDLVLPVEYRLTEGG